MKISNPLTGTTHELHIDDDKGVVEAYTETQIVPDNIFSEAREIAEMNRRQRPNSQAHWRHIGRIPSGIYEELKRKGIARDKVKMMKWLEDNRAFLVHTKDRL